MIAAQANEAAATLGRILDALLRAVPGATTPGRVGGQLRRTIGDTKASAVASLRDGVAGAGIAACFMAATAAGATLASYDSVRKSIALERPLFAPAIAVTTATLRLSLIETSRVLAGIEFKSRDEIDRVGLLINVAFDPAETQAADDHDAQVYRAIVALHAAVARHLAQTARPLPRMVRYSFPRRFPALYLANRIYADATRSDELIEENNVVHPLFCAQDLRALAR